MDSNNTWTPFWFKLCCQALEMLTKTLIVNTWGCNNSQARTEWRTVVPSLSTFWGSSVVRSVNKYMCIACYECSGFATSSSSYCYVASEAEAVANGRQTIYLLVLLRQGGSARSASRPRQTALRTSAWGRKILPIVFKLRRVPPPRLRGCERAKNNGNSACFFKLIEDLSFSCIEATSKRSWTNTVLHVRDAQVVNLSATCPSQW